MDELRKLFGGAGVISVADVAEALGVPRTTVYDWLQHGRFPGYSLGRVWVIVVDEVVQHLEAAAGGQPAATLPDALDSMFAGYGTYLTVGQAATLLDCSEESIINWIDAELIPAYKLRGTWSIVTGELREQMRLIRRAAPDRPNRLTPDQVADIFNDAPETLRPVAAAELLGINKPTIYRWLQEGTLPAYRVSNRLWVFLRDELVAWMRTRRSDQLH